MDIVSGLLFQGPPVTGPTYGSIQIEANAWQMVSIPSRFGLWVIGSGLDRGTVVAKVKEYVVDQLEDKYGVGVVSNCSCYFGDDGMFRSFLPGVTPPGNINNFDLMPIDPGTGLPEMVGFWIKSEHGSGMLLEYMSWFV